MNKLISIAQHFGPRIARVAFLVAMLAVGLSGLSSAGAAGPETQVNQLLHSLLLPICGALVVILAAGAAMFDAGIGRGKLIGRFLPRYLVLISIASIMVILTTLLASILFI